MIYELDTPVTFELDTSAKEQKLNEFLDWVCREYGDDMWSFFRENYDGILDNKLVVPWGEFPKGMRLSKVLMKVFGLSAEDVRQKLSMLIQSNKVTGKFCISVHPLDFLSASENNHGWRSCHALDGEYRTGNVSYMVDNCTLIAYLKSDAPDTKLPRFPATVPWNDKKWRCYFYIDAENKLIYAGKQYPFHSDAALTVLAQTLYKLNYFDDNLLREYHKEYRCFYERDEPIGYPEKGFHHWGINGETEINGEMYTFESIKVIVGDSINRRIVPMKKFLVNHPDACCFNDVIQSHNYSPYIMNYHYNYTYMPCEVTHKLIVGGPCTCVTCGKRLTADSDTFQCVRCRNDYNYADSTCARCGAVDDPENLEWTDGWGYLCHHCHEIVTE